MKIYTKTGDSGETSLFGGKRLPKDHVRISAYGEVDELNSHIGLVRDLISNEIQISLLTSIQNKLFVVGSYLAKDPDKEMALPELEDDAIEQLEIQIDSISETIPPLKNFILPGGHPVVAHCHIARCVCRRAERSVVALGHLEKIDAYILRYLNRLSDYLFVLCRLISHEMGAEEIKWMPSSSK
ncbi:MAG: cob(I)yrinic acid a,c-diamide adenosyltransferase [Bacteroidia bacterium]|nr:cob(I)yrinic acid a,c-diamide adenosyltransferase [Bacteroidia bacterium]